MYSLISVIRIIGMFRYDFFYFDQKKLTFGRLVLVFQPPIMSGFADFQDLAH